MLFTGFLRQKFQKDNYFCQKSIEIFKHFFVKILVKFSDFIIHTSGNCNNFSDWFLCCVFVANYLYQRRNLDSIHFIFCVNLISQNDFFFQNWPLEKPQRAISKNFKQCRLLLTVQIILNYVESKFRFQIYYVQRSLSNVITLRFLWRNFTKSIALKNICWQYFTNDSQTKRVPNRDFGCDRSLMTVKSSTKRE